MPVDIDSMPFYEGEGKIFTFYHIFFTAILEVMKQKEIDPELVTPQSRKAVIKFSYDKNFVFSLLRKNKFTLEKTASVIKNLSIKMAENPHSYSRFLTPWDKRERSEFPKENRILSSRKTITVKSWAMTVLEDVVCTNRSDVRDIFQIGYIPEFLKRIFIEMEAKKTLDIKPSPSMQIAAGGGGGGSREAVWKTSAEM